MILLSPLLPGAPRSLSSGYVNLSHHASVRPKQHLRPFGSIPHTSLAHCYQREGSLPFYLSTFLPLYLQLHTSPCPHDHLCWASHPCSKLARVPRMEGEDTRHLLVSPPSCPRCVSEARGFTASELLCCVSVTSDILYASRLPPMQHHHSSGRFSSSPE